MIPKQDNLRASAEYSPLKTPEKHTGSDSVCDISSLNRNQTRLSRELDEAGRDRIAARFWAKVNKTDGCWLWTASAMDTQGHGQFVYSVGGKQRHVYAHRVAYELCVESITDGKVVCHVCDVPACVRPDHLFLGTQGDNLADARQKGRLNVWGPRTNKLTYADRLAIYLTPRRHRLVVELARQYGVTKACISKIRDGQFVGAPVFERVPHVAVPVRGDLHVGQSLAYTAEPSRSLSDGGLR